MTIEIVFKWLNKAHIIIDKLKANDQLASFVINMENLYLIYTMMGPLSTFIINRVVEDISKR
jgi:hypothetical protein